MYAKTLSTLLIALAMLGLGQLMVHAQESDNSTLFGSNTPDTQNSGKEWSEPYENLAQECWIAWMGSSAAQSCNLKSVTEIENEIENPAQCEIRAECRAKCTGPGWLCFLNPSVATLEYQGSVNEIRRLHSCDDVLKLDGC